MLADEELFALEDAIADAFEAPDGDDRVVRMVAMSARMAVDVAVGETVILLHPPSLPSVGVSIGVKRECQQNDSLADG